MSLVSLPQASSSIMSIDAITSPCYSNDTETSIKSRQSSISSSYRRDHSPILDMTISDEFASTKPAMIQPIANVFSASPSFSSFTISDLENESIGGHSYSQQNSLSSWIRPLGHSRIPTNNSLLTDRSENQFKGFDFFDGSRFSENFNYVYSGSDKSSKFNRKGDALAVRRARNKLASAKYRAKKQALTHAMQDRVMHLATQVMALRNELSQTKKREIETKLKYERLLQHFQHSSNIISENASIKPLF